MVLNRFDKLSIRQNKVHTGSLRMHMKPHSGEKAYKCKQCDFAYVTSSKLRNHKKKTYKFSQ